MSFLVVKLVLCVPLCDLCVVVRFDLHRNRWLNSYFIGPFFQNHEVAAFYSEALANGFGKRDLSATRNLCVLHHFEFFLRNLVDKLITIDTLKY